MTVGYKNDITMAQGLAEYLQRYHLGDGGYNDRWFKINFFWKFTLTLPNISNRVRAVKFHDLHHVLAEYETGLRGEAEIGAWEIASGCGKYYAAWILNIGSFAYGLILFPAHVYKAFIRGRHSKNLYHDKVYDELLGVSIGDMRRELHIPMQDPKPRGSDRFAFAGWIVNTILFYALPTALVVVAVKSLLQ